MFTRTAKVVKKAIHSEVIIYDGGPSLESLLRKMGSNKSTQTTKIDAQDSARPTKTWVTLRSMCLYSLQIVVEAGGGAGLKKLGGMEKCAGGKQ